MKELCDIQRSNFRFCRGAQVGTCHSFFPFDVLAVLPINLKSKQIITRIVINYVVTKYKIIVRSALDVLMYYFFLDILVN